MQKIILTGLTVLMAGLALVTVVHVHAQTATSTPTSTPTPTPAAVVPTHAPATGHALN